MKHGKDNSLSNPKESFFTKTITRDKGDVDDDKMARRNALEDVGASVEEDLGQQGGQGGQGGQGRQGEESKENRKENRNSHREEEAKEGRENKTKSEQKEEEKEE